MDVKVHADGHPLFLPGDRVNFNIVLRARDVDSGPKVLAFVSAQTCCQLTLNPRVINAEKLMRKVSTMMSLYPWEQCCLAQSSSHSRSTSLKPLQGSSHSVAFASPLNMICCDFLINSSKPTSFGYQECIPVTCPPSFRGNCARLTYKVIISYAYPNSAVETVHMSFRVAMAPDGIRPSRVLGTTSPPSNPFLLNDRHRWDSTSEPNFEYNGRGCASSSFTKRTFAISSSSGLVGRLKLPRLSYRAGDHLSGVFDFSNADVQCLKFSVQLKLRETIDPDLAVDRVRCDWCSTSSGLDHTCLYFKQSTFSLPIPQNTTPSYSSPLMSFGWWLSFVFSLAASPIRMHQVEDGDHSSVSHLGPELADVQLLTWDLPISILVGPAFN